MTGFLIFYIIVAILNVINGITAPLSVKETKDKLQKKLKEVVELEEKIKDYPKGVEKVAFIFTQVLNVLFYVGLIYFLSLLLKLFI